jgi:hypothetical protein
MAMRVKNGVGSTNNPTDMQRGGSRPKPPKAVALRASLEATRSMSDHQKSKRRLTDKTVAFAPAAETCARAVVLSKSWTKCAVWLHSASNWKKASNTPERLSRQNRFHTLFHLPNSAGSARHVMLCTVK